MARKFDTAVVTIGIDPGKNTLHLVGLDARGQIVLREKVARTKIGSRLANVPPCLAEVRSSPESRHRWGGLDGPLRATFGLMHHSNY
jgi:hypothetical protein